MVVVLVVVVVDGTMGADATETVVDVAVGVGKVLAGDSVDDAGAGVVLRVGAIGSDEASAAMVEGATAVPVLATKVGGVVE